MKKYLIVLIILLMPLFIKSEEIKNNFENSKVEEIFLVRDYVDANYCVENKVTDINNIFGEVIGDKFFSNNDDYETKIDYNSLCSNPNIKKAAQLIGYIIQIIRWIVPLMLIVFGMLDFGKATIASDDNAIKKATSTLIRRTVAGIIVFFVPTILLAILNGIEITMGIEDKDNSQFGICTKCILSPYNDCNVNDNTLPSDSELPDDNSNTYIKDIKSDGVIITINAKNITGIKGYYFSYDGNRPINQNDGYVKTNKSTIDIVRLPGKTYVWVEDSNGKVSQSKTITISNEAILNTLNENNRYEILDGITLENYLNNHGWSVEEFDKLIARSVRASGLGKKQSAATAAVALQTVLAQKYGIKIPYFGQRYSDFGANPSWGVGYGLDCSGFITWTFWQAGIKYNAITDYIIHPPYWDGWPKIAFSSTEAEVGDILVTKTNLPDEGRHVKLVVGKTNDSLIIIESTYGVIASTYSFRNPLDYLIEKGELFNSLKYYTTYEDEEYPSGF